MISNKSCGEGGGRGAYLELWCLSSQFIITCDEAAEMAEHMAADGM